MENDNSRDPVAGILKDLGIKLHNDGSAVAVPAPVPVLEPHYAKSATETTKVYHVILDCDYSDNSKLFDRPIMFGKVRSTHSNDYIAVVFDFESAKKIADRIISQAVIIGTIGNKQHPVFGAIILGMELNSKVHNVGKISGDYSKLGKESNIIMYESDDRYGASSKRGLVPKNILPTARIVSKTYMSTLETPVPVGFALFNLDPLKTPNTIMELKQIHKKSMSHELVEIFVDGMTSHQSGGGTIDYATLAHQKKTEYKRLKKIAQKMGII